MHPLFTCTLRRCAPPPSAEHRMRRLLLACLLPFSALGLSSVSTDAAAAEACDVPPPYGLSPLALSIRQTACNEHRLWFRPFIDREGRAASLAVTEAENE